jgi:hypothetical protein
MRWRQVIGRVEVLSLASHPRCNWTAVPKGSDAEIAAISKAINLVRYEHPRARAPSSGADVLRGH